MDICSASNFERYIYDLLEGDADRVKFLWDKLKSDGKFDLSKVQGQDMATLARHSGFWSHSVSEETCRRAISYTNTRSGIDVDTHTAVAMDAAIKLRTGDVPVIVMETAQACKFDDAVINALGRPPARPRSFQGIEKNEHFVTRMFPGHAQVMEYIKANV